MIIAQVYYIAHPAYTPGVVAAIRTRIEHANRRVRGKPLMAQMQGWQRRYGYCAACRWDLAQAQQREASA